MGTEMKKHNWSRIALQRLLLNYLRLPVFDWAYLKTIGECKKDGTAFGTKEEADELIDHFQRWIASVTFQSPVETADASQ